MITPSVWPPGPTEEQLTVPRLSADGQHVEGWCRKPTDGIWRPTDLLWMPPGATKSADMDRAGGIVDVLEGPGDHSWIVAQLGKRQKYLDILRERVRSGGMKLTAALAKMLGLDADGAELVQRTGPIAYGKSLEDARRAVAIGRRLAGYPIDRDTGLADIGRASTDEARIKAVASAAAKRYGETGDVDAAMAEIRAGIARTRSA